MPKKPSSAAKQRAFRATHAPDETPLVGIWLRKGDAFCLAADVITDSLRQLALDAIHEFWPEEEQDAAAGRGRALGPPRPQKAKDDPSRSPSTATMQRAGSTASTTGDR